ncbi:MAG: O-antigen ligase family protein, partial [Candidatus Eremiobacteraeota bacterium]|nr:O-antigen ligase family protein [Candidatus Eremiobacteraeota bacterium]MBV9408328.1 O-antigen ligase family protein [Candidatus Eremiobacteraeota bacterium]
MSGPHRAVVASLAAAVALIPLCPALVTLTHAPVPGVALLAPPLAVALAIVLAALVSTWVFAFALVPLEQLPASATSAGKPVPVLWALAAFPAAAALAALLGFDPLGGALFVAILVGDVVWYAAIMRFVRDARALDVLLGTFVVSGAVAALLAIVLALARVPAALYTIGHGRAIGTFVLPGELAGYLIVYVPVAFAVARRGGRLAFVGWIGFAIGATALALTFSRAGWAGFAAAAATFAVARRGRLRYAVAVTGVAALTLGLVFNAHHDPSENFTRLGIWEGAVQTIVRFPFSGVGPLDFANVYPLLRAPAAEPAANHGHSIVLTVAAECGLVGLAALVWGWWRFAAALRARWSPTASHAN